MIHLKILGYLAVAIAMFVLLFIAVPALISAKSTIAVCAGYALIFGAGYLVGVLLYNGYKSLVNPKKETL